MLDASKAFDRVNYCKLVRLLLIKKLPPIIIRLLLNLYLFNFAQVAWNGTLSSKFRVLNGVRQGAILCPVLFCVYFDVLLCKLSSNSDGWYIGLYFVGALAYADDLILLAYLRYSFIPIRFMTAILIADSNIVTSIQFINLECDALHVEYLW